MLCEAVCQCDKVYVGVGYNTDKQELLTPRERVENIYKAISEFVSYYSPNPQNLNRLNEAEQTTYQRLCKNPNVIEVMSYKGLTLDTALKLRVNVLIRGVRDGKDIAYEDSLNKINQILLSIRGERLDNLILKPKNQAEIAHISSSTVKSLCHLQEYIALQAFVSPAVHNEISKKYLKSVFQNTAKYFGVTDNEKIESEYQTIFETNNNVITASFVSFLINYINIQDVLRGPIREDIKHQLILSAFYRGEKRSGVANKDVETQLMQFIGGDVQLLMALINVSEIDKEYDQLTPQQYLILENERKLVMYSAQNPMYLSALNELVSPVVKIKSAGLKKIDLSKKADYQHT